MDYIIEFYEDSNGNLDVCDFLEALRTYCSRRNSIAYKANQYDQLAMHIGLLAKNGTNMIKNFTEHLEDGIWELRPGENSILYFCADNSRIVLLHHFMKNTQKTPKSEIEKAKKEREDYLSRIGWIGDIVFVTWKVYKEYVKGIDSENRSHMEFIENMTDIVNPLIQQRKDSGISQGKLTEMCYIPQSSIDKIEEFMNYPSPENFIELNSQEIALWKLLYY